jgi:hypothetical protein
LADLRLQDKPTLHLGEHHLLHGKITTLPKPYAVIRRALTQNEGAIGEVEGDADEEDDIKEEETRTRTPKGKAKAPDQQKGAEEDDEEEGPLFPPDPDGPLFQTPIKGIGHASSSPSTVLPSSAIKDYSSELDFSSPPMSDNADEEEEERPETRKRKASGNKGDPSKRQRTRRYEVVGVVRKKVVFALR